LCSLFRFDIIVSLFYYTPACPLNKSGIKVLDYVLFSFLVNYSAPNPKMLLISVYATVWAGRPVVIVVNKIVKFFVDYVKCMCIVCSSGTK